MANVAVIGCAQSDILYTCKNTITSLTTRGHKVYAIIASSDEPKSSSSAEIPNFSQMTAIGIKQTFSIEGFDYSAITQANADIINSYIKNVKPSIVIIPSWKSPNHKRKILARASLIACRGLGTILMYEVDANNTSFTPNIIFEISTEQSLMLQQQQQQLTDKTIRKTEGAIVNENELDDTKTLVNKSMLQQKVAGCEQLEEKFESHRTLILEEEELF
jgi:hypothetical protein